MRSVWNGSIAFGLVSIPVKLYSAVSQKSIGFKLLCKDCMTPIRYERHCDGCEGPIDWDNTLKALDLGDGQYLPFTKEELEKIKPEKTDRIEVVEFIDGGELEPLYYDRFYFCAPSRKTERAYKLVDQLTEDELKLEEFKDEFAERLQEMIEKKEKIVVEETAEETPFDEESLMEALRK